jgi:hypothetical protein
VVARRRGALVEAAREAALRRVGRAYPDFAGLTRAEQQARLVEVFGIRTDDAQKVLAPTASAHAWELMVAIGIYQRIQERLSGRTK